MNFDFLSFMLGAIIWMLSYGIVCAFEYFSERAYYLREMREKLRDWDDVSGGKR